MAKKKKKSAKKVKRPIRTPRKKTSVKKVIRRVPLKRKAPERKEERDDTAEIIKMLGGDVQRFSGKTVLLSGGAGFLGRQITALVKRLNAEVLSAPCTLFPSTTLLPATRRRIRKLVSATRTSSPSGPT